MPTVCIFACVFIGFHSQHTPRGRSIACRWHWLAGSQTALKEKLHERSVKRTKLDEQSVERMKCRPTERTNEVSTERSVDRTKCRLNEVSTERSVDRTKCRPNEVSTERSVERRLWRQTYRVSLFVKTTHQTAANLLWSRTHVDTVMFV